MMGAFEESLKLVKEAMSAIEKQFGKGAVMRLSAEHMPPPVEAVSTGSIGVDMALGVGGVAKGRIIEIFGPESSGKTTLALQVIAQAHKKGSICAFVDAEHALDMGYAKALGVDPEKLLIAQPDSGEQALEICETLVRSGGVEVLVLDSVAALVPRAEIEGEMGDAHMGVQARLMSQAMRKLTGVAHKTGCVLIFINQLRQKIGVTFGNPEVTTGGNALKFYASVRIDVRKGAPIKEGDKVVGSRTRIKVVKNKLAAPFKEVEVDVLYGKGIWQAGDMLEQAVACEVVQKAGAYYTYGGKQLGHGREKSALALEADETLWEEVRKKVWESAGVAGVAHAPEEGQAAA